jgi:hypothetical protein
MLGGAQKLADRKSIMFIIIKNEICDYDLDLLSELLRVVDGHIERILGNWQDADMADELGYFDRTEHIAGLGFVACQAYLTATYGYLGVAKSDALTIGPSHKSGLKYVQIINHASNYWKHRDEWHLDKSPAKENRIRDAFDAVGFPVDLDYPLSGILTELADPAPAAFSPLIAKLAKWRDALRELKR